MKKTMLARHGAGGARLRGAAGDRRGDPHLSNMTNPNFTVSGGAIALTSEFGNFGCKKVGGDGNVDGTGETSAR